ncbi:BnaA10g09590D [Brassica napus]|uniref:(rape) hypothetical protein n=1 Tax=Brassica napus TaxID=3708 RepID=A0A078FS17_BRANA|nr:unnamed protein product [Brassica napus]CDY17325.1 BnaA10g09590D [Brassica napus]
MKVNNFFYKLHARTWFNIKYSYNINANTLEKCRPAVTGNNPPLPGDACCIVLQAADLECVCKFKSHIPILATKSHKVHDLLRKCGIKTIPPACQGKTKVS